MKYHYLLVQFALFVSDEIIMRLCPEHPPCWLLRITSIGNTLLSMLDTGIKSRIGGSVDGGMNRSLHTFNCE